MSISKVSRSAQRICPGSSVSDAMAQLYRVIPLQLNGRHVLTLATCDPQNLSMQDELATFFGLRDIRLLVCSTESQILKVD